MAFQPTSLPALDAARAPVAVRTLPAALQTEFMLICSQVGREDKLSATTAQLARFNELRTHFEFDPAGTDWDNLRARIAAVGGRLTRTHPDDGPVQFLLGGCHDFGSLWWEDTLAEAIAVIEKEEAEFAVALDYARRLAVWKDGVAARKARKAARASLGGAGEVGKDAHSTAQGLANLSKAD